MADVDYTLASKVNPPPQIDPLKTLQGIEQYRSLQSENKTKGLEAHQKQIDTESLGRYGQSGSLKDLQGATPDLANTAAETQIKDMQLKSETLSRTAHRILGEPDPKEKTRLWDEALDHAVKKGWVPAKEAELHRGKPNDLLMEGIVRQNMGVAANRETLGTAAEAQAAARAKYEPREVDPTKPYEYPAVRPGGPLADGSPVGHFNSSNFNQRFGSTDQNLTGHPNERVVSTTVTPAPADLTKADVNSYSKEVPEVKVGNTLPIGPGVVNQGMDPLFAKARNEGFDKYNKEYAPAASEASKAQATLGSLESEIRSGRVSTDRLAELKTSVAGFLYGMTKDASFVKNSTGVDLSSQELLNKDTTRMGLTFARQTEGAREAVQAIRIALAANPSMLTSETGNLKVIGVMKAAADYDKETSKAAHAYMQKNGGHLQGFEDWWADKHPASSFISKAVPYQIPSSPKDFKNGITYEFQTGIKNGKPVMGKGTYNADTHMMDPVR